MRIAGPPRPISRRAALGLALGAACLAPAAALGAGPLPPLSEFLQYGAFGPWTGAAEGDTYVLSNTTAPGAVQYFLAGHQRSEEGRRVIAVDVEIRQGGEESRAGLIYGYRKEPTSYFLFVLEGGRGVSLYLRHPDSVERPVSVVSGQIRPGVNRLEIREQGGLVGLFVNGAQIGAYGAAGVGQGAAGIVAWGMGVFAFRDFTQTVAE
ncbi:MAG: hypothetical protein IRY94_18165 [Rhodospirillaceae bacterium]|nr:hypothetical protein [Rhodospirillaceae bacterium]